MSVSVLVCDADFTLYVGDALETLRTLPDGSVDCCVTSPPYWGLRDYGTGSWEGGDESCYHAKVADPTAAVASSTLGGGKKTTGHLQEGYRDACGKCGARRVDRQLGLEGTPDEYVAGMVAVFREVHRVLADTGTLWLNLGDSYANKQLQGMPWRVAFALQADGWYLRSAITWVKPNVMPESVTDRPTKATEMVFLLTKNAKYWYDTEAVREPHKPDGRAVTKVVGQDGSLQHRNGERWPGTGRNLRDWWEIATQPFTARALGGGDGRITSPDCPAHGDLRRQATTVGRDAHADASSLRTPHSDGRHAQGPLDDSVPTAPHLAPATAPESSDSPVLASAAAATPHSNGSRRTDPASATSPACTASAQTAGRTGDTSASPASDELFDHTPASRSAPDGSDAHPSAQTPGGTARRSSCTCKYIDHFATYPEALVRRCILAGCPEWVCGTCGKPRERLTDGASYYKDRDTSRQPQKYAAMGGGHGGVGRGPKGNLGESIAQTVGWSDCGHNNYRAGVVFDPFGGSGTTALVARNHGRKAVLIELNADYAALAAKRLQQLSLLAEPA